MSWYVRGESDPSWGIRGGFLGEAVSEVKMSLSELGRMCGWGVRVALDKGTSMYNSLETKRAYTSRKLNIPQFGGYPFVREEVVQEERKGEGYL